MTLADGQGSPVRVTVVSAPDSDGRFEVEIGRPDGMREVRLLTAEELDAMRLAPGESAGQPGEAAPPEEQPTQGVPAGAGGRLTRKEAQTIVAEMEKRAEAAPEMELMPENWAREFGEDGIVNTPIGEVKQGENQYLKLARQGRDGKLGMIRPTLEKTDVIIEDDSEAIEGDATERDSSYVYVKAFTKPDGSRYYYFTSVTVRKGNREVVVSNQEKRRNVLTNLLLKGKLIWKHPDNVSAAPDMADGLYSSQGKTSDPATEGTEVPQTNSDAKGSASAGEKQASGSEKAAVGGNSALGHVPVDSKGEPVYEAAEPGTAWDAIVEQAGGDEAVAQSVAEDMAADKEAELERLRDGKPEGGTTVAEKIAALNEHKAAIERARAEVEHWKEIAGEAERRRQERAEEEAAKKQATAFGKENSVRDDTTDTGMTFTDKGNGTVAPQNAVAEGEGGKPVWEEQAEREEPAEGKGEAEAGGEPVDEGKGTGAATAQKGKAVSETGNGLFQYFTGSIAELISQAKQSAQGLVKKMIASISSRLKKDLTAKGVEISDDDKHVIDNNAIRHILKNHGSRNEENRGATSCQ